MAASLNASLESTEDALNAIAEKHFYDLNVAFDVSRKFLALGDARLH